MEFVDRILKCADCGAEFIFTAGEQQFFQVKQFENDPKRCKRCKAKRGNRGVKGFTETQAICAECGLETTVPFKPTQGRPVFCRQCFDKSGAPAGLVTGDAIGRQQQLELMASGSLGEVKWKTRPLFSHRIQSEMQSESLHSGSELEDLLSRRAGETDVFRGARAGRAGYVR